MTMKDALVHVDPSTGEELAPLVPHEPTNLGLLDLSDEQIASLEEPVTDEEVRIKPDNFGTIYLCHTGYRRRLNRAFHRMALSQISRSGNEAARIYFQRKISEGKSKSQALVCLCRQMMNIVWMMMKHKTEYRAPSVSSA